MSAPKGQRPWNAGSGKGYVDRRGYRWIRVGGRSVREHRHVLSVYLGRPLLASEVVHHRDGNPSNNAIENLELTSNGQHTRKHHVGVKRPDEAKAAMRRAARDREQIRRLRGALQECAIALSGFLGSCDAQEIRDSFSDMAKAEKQARAAIAKATGGQP